MDEAREFLARGEFDRAKHAYLIALFRDRYNREGMLGLGEAFAGLRDYQSARTVFAQAAARHPDSSHAHSSLGGVLLELDDLEGARAAFERALALQPGLRKPWAGLGIVYERQGDIARADRAWREAFRQGGPAVSAYRGSGEPLRVLVLSSAVGGNVPLEPVFDDRIFQVLTLFAESYHEDMPLPAHDVVFSVVGNAELSTRAVDKAEMMMAATNAPAINHPALVRRTGRVEVADRLRDVPGIVTPRMHLVRKAELRDDRGLGWPLLVRALGFHGGEHFVKVDVPEDLPAAVATLEGDEVLAIEYLDTRNRDGRFRKYRMLAIDGRLYAAHLAISRDWKVHYFSAQHGGLADDEEGAFLADPQAGVGRDALHALERAAALLALDYAGFDFTLDADGRVVLFEANATMRIGANADAIAAVQAMIAGRVRSS